jgi:hypothetical protein
MSEQVTEAVLDFLRAECAARPTLLVLEDLHWGDAGTVKLCGTALRKLTGCRLMVLALARPDVDDVFPELWSNAAHAVILRPLSKKAGERLARQVLGPEASTETVARIVAQSEGNALFLEELIRAAAEGRSGVASGTVLAMMQARIGRLPARARRVLRAASVFGETARQGGVHALLGGSMSNEEIDGCLTLLQKGEILEEWRDSRSQGEKAYRFHHALVRDAAYALSSEEERVAWHRLAGEHLEARSEPDSLVLAEHFVRGGEPHRAAPHYLRAGEEALEANDMGAALSSAKRGLACGAAGEMRGALLSVEVAACMWQQQFDEVVALGAEAIDLLPEGTRRWCRSLRYTYASATYAQRTALLTELEPRFARAEPSADARSEYVLGATWLANMLGVRGMKEAARTFRARAWQTGAAVGKGDLLAWGFLNWLEAADHSLLEEAPWSRLTRYREARDALRVVGEQRSQNLLHALRARALDDFGDVAEAEADLRDALAHAERRSDPVSLVYARAFLAYLLARTAPLDHLDEPERLAHDVIATQNTSLLGFAHGAIAEVGRRRGDLVAAEREARMACDAVRAFPAYAGPIVALHARILLEQQRVGEALAVAEAGVRELERLGLEGAGEIDLRLSLTETLHAVGRTQDARAVLADILPRLEKRLADIPEPAARERYLTNAPANARVVALAKAWLGEEAVRVLGA